MYSTAHHPDDRSANDVARRTAPRLRLEPHQLPIRLHLGGCSFDGIAVDTSTTGIGLQIDGDPPAQHRLIDALAGRERCAVELLDEDARLMAEARLTNVAMSTTCTRIGVVFDDALVAQHLFLSLHAAQIEEPDAERSPA